ncbi:MAG: glycosyltransferase family 4 protein [Holosporales bacterium]|jgi:glycosyltransferase involved in cell wall biosynthesis
MRILHLNTGSKGGIQTAFVQTVRGLSHRERIVQRVLSHNHHIDTFRNLHNVTTASIKAEHQLRDFGNHWRFRYEIVKFNPDIIQLWSHKVSWFLTPRWPKKPTCIFLGTSIWPRRFQRLKKTVDAWLTCSEQVRQDTIALGALASSVGRLLHFPDHVDVAPASRAAFGLKDDDIIAVAAGRLSHQKAFDILIPALAKARGITLLLAGEGEDEAMLRALAEQHGVADRVRFLGWRSDVANLFAMADIVLMPSRYEPFGFVMLEAMAQGTPLILTNVKGPDEVAQHLVNSFTVEPENIDDLAAALRTLRDDPALRARLGQAGRDTVRTTYNENTSINQLIDFYQKMRFSA